MKKTKQILHEECEECENLKALSVYMDGSAYYVCRCTPNHVEKERHKTPCNRFINCNDYFVIVEKKTTYPKFLGEDGYVYSEWYARHFNTEEEAVKNIPNDGFNWEILHVNWMERQK